ncbi:MAG: ABC transporter substrate-binding protein [Proteobacteria bacterium]|nr:ABC transporter substrate-binding protein [Pseudomonadota bacterium]
MPRSLIVAFSVTTGLLAAAGLPGPAEAQQTVLKMVPHADLKVTDPISTTATITIDHAMMIYDQLYAWDAGLNPKPQMAEGHTLSADGLTYTFTLRSGLKFHDGSPVTARDAVASVKRWEARDTMGQKLAEMTKAMEAVNDTTFTIVLKEPYGYTLTTLASSGGNVPAIMRLKDAEADPFKAITENVGSGPFKLVASEWVPGSKVVYEKNADYVPRGEPAAGLTGGKVVKVARVEWTSIPEAATAAAALVAGEIDMIEAINNDQTAILKKSGTVVVEALAPLGWFGMLRPNYLHPPFNNAKARQALALMVDQQEYMQAAFGGGQICFSYYTCGSPNGTEVGSEPYRKPDFARAKQLLAESGYKGEKIVLLGAGDLFHHHAVAQVTAERLKQIGINVDLQMADWGAVVTRRGKKDDPYAGGWHIFQTFSDGVTGYSPLTNFGTNLACDGKNWFGWPCDEATEKLRDRFIRAANETEQAQALEALHRRMWEVVPYVMLGKYERLGAWRSNLQGVLKANVLALWNISKS